MNPHPLGPVAQLIEVALDEPNPSKELVYALNAALTFRKHPDRDFSLDRPAGRPKAVKLPVRKAWSPEEVR